MLTLQKKDLIIEYNRHLEDKIGDARHEFQRELAGSLGRLKGIDSALQCKCHWKSSSLQKKWLLLYVVEVLGTFNGTKMEGRVVH